jgi:putative transposase
VGGAGANRKAVRHLQGPLDVNERPARRGIDADRTSTCYQSRRGDDAQRRCKLRALAHQRRRLYILLRCDGVIINRQKTQRQYCEEGLTVRRPGAVNSSWNAHTATSIGIAEPVPQP